MVEVNLCLMRGSRAFNLMLGIPRLAAFIDLPPEGFLDCFPDRVVAFHVAGRQNTDSEKLRGLLAYEIEAQIAAFIQK